MSACPGGGADPDCQPTGAYGRPASNRTGHSHAACADCLRHRIAEAHTDRAAAYCNLGTGPHRTTRLTHATISADAYGCAADERSPTYQGCVAHALRVHLVCVEPAEGVPR